MITPQLSVMDRLACYWYHQDPQCWRQAILISRAHALDWDALDIWAMKEGQPCEEILRLKNLLLLVSVKLTARDASLIDFLSLSRLWHSFTQAFIWLAVSLLFSGLCVH